jgi:uncharacterized protein YdhG (YjbR/CyaY superfamily)
MQVNNWFEKALLLRHDQLTNKNRVISKEHEAVKQRSEEILNTIREKAEEEIGKLAFELEECYGMESAILMFNSYKQGIYDGLELAKLLK